MFNPFEAARIPEDKCETLDYGTHEIVQLSNFYGFADHTEILNKWRSLLFAFADRNEEFCRIKSTQNDVQFWSYFLKISTLPWTSRMTFLVKTTLALPIGSADAERGFSIMNNVKTSKRSSLDHSTLEAIMRIKINGPPLDKFDA